MTTDTRADNNRTCECGCGTALVRRGYHPLPRFIFGHRHRTYRPSLIGGYVLVWAPEHPRAQHHKGRMYEHVLLAEKALGKYLPPQAEVHHIDENRANNDPCNLVICEDIRYHHLLHRRKRVLDAGGDPNTQQLCCRCHVPKCFDEFHRNASRPNGRGQVCKSCSSIVGSACYRKKKTAIAEAALALIRSKSGIHDDR